MFNQNIKNIKANMHQKQAASPQKLQNAGIQSDQKNKKLKTVKSFEVNGSEIMTPRYGLREILETNNTQK
jgi:hypothetical protein